MAYRFVISDHRLQLCAFVVVPAIDLYHRDDEARSGSNTECVNEAELSKAVTVSTSGANVIANPIPHPAGTESDSREGGRFSVRCVRLWWIVGASLL